jgi:hypothetical protein
MELNDPTYIIIENNKEKFYKILGKEKVDVLIEELVWNEAKRQGKKGTDKAAFRKTITQYLPGKEDLLCAEYDLSLLKRAGNWSAYLPKAEKFATDFCQNDWERLNNIANNFLENYSTKSVLQKGLKISLRSVAVHPNYMNLLTTAELYQKMKDKVNAKLYAEKALQITTADTSERNEVEAFMKSLK